VLTQGSRAFLASQFEGQPVRYGELTFNQAQRATFLDGNRFTSPETTTTCADDAGIDGE